MRLLAWLMLLAVTPLASFVLDSLLSLPGCLFGGNIFVSGLWLGTFLAFLVFLTGFMLMGVHLTHLCPMQPLMVQLAPFTKPVSGWFHMPPLCLVLIKDLIVLKSSL